MSTSRSRPRLVRTVAQATALVVGAALLVLAPEPSLALVPEMDVTTVTPTLETVDAPTSPGAEALVESLQEHAAIGPLGDAPAGSAAEDGPVPEQPADLDGQRQVALAEDTAEFRMIGVQYRQQDDGVDRADHDPALLRVRTDGVWGEWFAVETGEHNPDPVTGEPVVEGSSDPIWVDRAQAFEVDVPGEATDVEVHLVVEGDRTVTLTDGTDAAEGAAAGAPPIRSRGSWGAAPYRGSPDYGSHVGRAIVHHTVNGNGYSSGQVPGMIRGIQSYHQNGNGWSDIGYNFVIDRFGGIWEGRQGGVASPVIGAHAQGHNTNTVGIAALGDFTGVGPGGSMISAYGRLIGWKLSLSGTVPNSTTVLGHRNVGQTGCPGNGLYNQLSAIRSGARSQFDAQHPTPSFAQRGWTVTGSYDPVAGDFDGDGRGDILWYGPGGANDYSWFGNSNRTFAGRGVSISGTYEPFVGDFNGDGRDDVFLYGAGGAKDAILFGNANRTFGVRLYTVSGTYEPVAGDFNGDGRDDVFWYAPGAGQDAIWFGNSNLSFTGRQYTVNGTYRASSGDFDGDRRHDVLWYGDGGASDYIWYGGSNLQFQSIGVAINGTGYQPIIGDFNRNLREDVLFYNPGTGSDPIWVAYANRTFRNASTTVNGTAYVPLVADFDGNWVNDVFWYGEGAIGDSAWYGT